MIGAPSARVYRRDMADVDTPEIATVRAFLTALEEFDLDTAIGLGDEDMVYHNVSLPAARGIGAVEKTLRAMTRYGTGFRAELVNIAGNGPVVLTERMDTLIVGRWESRFWVCGTFEVREGRIQLWRDYFDWANVAGASLAGAMRAIAGSLRGAAR